tara:strand:+ start:1013 stop:1582 length:570 start_codon:yes stop_codon:yes gene_type:complete
MTHHENLKVLAFVGLAGSGKSTAVEYFTEKDYPKVYFGGIIYEAMKEAGIERTAESERVFREELREKYGNDVVANRIIEQIRELAEAGQHKVIADGLYSWSEYKALQRAFPGELTLVSVVAPRHLRYHRLANRAERPYTNQEAYARDTSQIEHLEQGGPIAIADHFVINKGSLEELHAQLDETAREIDF